MGGARPWGGGGGGGRPGGGGRGARRPWRRRPRVGCSSRSASTGRPYRRT